MPSWGKYAAAGAGLGAAWGGTFGRDPGQSRLGGALSGAIGGGLMGAGGARYGGAIARSSDFRRSSRIAFGSQGGHRMAGMNMGARAAGKAAYSQMRADASRARNYFGASLRGNQPVNATRWSEGRSKPVNRGTNNVTRWSEGSSGRFMRGPNGVPIPRDRPSWMT